MIHGFQSSPTTIVVLTLALAMGTSAVIFTVFDSVLQIVPARDRGRTVYVASTDPAHGAAARRPPPLISWSGRRRRQRSTPSAR